MQLEDTRKDGVTQLSAPRWVYFDDIGRDLEVHSRATLRKMELEGRIPELKRVGSMRPRLPLRDWNLWMLENFGTPSYLCDPNYKADS